MSKTNSKRPEVLGRGRPSRETRLEWVRDALKYLDDPVYLEDESPLGNHPAVVHLAATTFRGKTCARGLAARSLLREALVTIARDLKGTLLGDLAAGTYLGHTQASVAEAHGVGDEWLSRRWKTPLLVLVLGYLDGRESAAQRAA